MLKSRILTKLIKFKLVIFLLIVVKQTNIVQLYFLQIGYTVYRVFR